MNHIWLWLSARWSNSCSIHQMTWNLMGDSWTSAARFFAALLWSCTLYTWDQICSEILKLYKTKILKLKSSASFSKTSRLEHTFQTTHTPEPIKKFIQESTPSFTLSGLSLDDWFWVWLLRRWTINRCSVCYFWALTLWFLFTSLGLRSHSKMGWRESWTYLTSS
jgi:hypothetical protein